LRSGGSTVVGGGHAINLLNVIDRKGVEALM